jgi:hypothetical protein
MTNGTATHLARINSHASDIQAQKRGDMPECPVVFMLEL